MSITSQDQECCLWLPQFIIVLDMVVYEIRHEKEMGYKDCKGHKKMVVLYRWLDILYKNPRMYL